MNRLKKILVFLARPRFLLCFGLAWMLTNGWAYLFVLLGPALHLPFLTALGTGYLALLWLPFTPEKILTVAIAVRLLKLLFPEDRETLRQLLDLSVKA
ncbi:MAG: hypothetical protein IKR06_01720 [Erysipelotrichaceae bacterium]|nr:hypothetical protein [Erysipelotrichaceae bacterium]MBR4121988.1 hypothetical protein [Erysipelotrichaceae bacterium]